MSQTSEANLSAQLHDHAGITSALREATRAALHRHRIAGVPIAVWHEGKMRLIKADDIQIDARLPHKEGV